MTHTHIHIYSHKQPYLTLHTGLWQYENDYSFLLYLLFPIPAPFSEFLIQLSLFFSLFISSVFSRRLVLFASLLNGGSITRNYCVFVIFSAFDYKREDLCIAFFSLNVRTISKNETLLAVVQSLVWKKCQILWQETRIFFVPRIMVNICVTSF